jgi:membrane protease YdiL (CAAX protease family)
MAATGDGKVALKFKCHNCGADIVVKFLKVGETAKCKLCDAANEVPETAIVTLEEPIYLRYEEAFGEEQSTSSEATAQLEEQLKTLKIPFANFRLRNLLVWVIISTFAVGFIDAELETDSLGSILDCLWHFAFHGVVLLWASWHFMRSNVSVRRVMGALPDSYRWLPAVACVVPLILFSMGSGQITGYLWWLISPSFAKEWFAAEDYSICRMLLVFILVPPVEELFFRGILINKWSVRWGVKRAVLISSLLFAILHQNIIGAFAYGFVLAVLYIKTRTLLVPIVCHVLINLIALGMGMVWENSGLLKIIHTLNQLLGSGPWFGLLCLILSAPWVVYFMRRNWPRRDWSAPYFA